MFDFIFYLLGKIMFFTGAVKGDSFPAPLSPEEEKLCLEKMKGGDKEARDKLIEHNLRLVAHIVKKYNGSADKDDLISVGSIGLIKAINSYEEGKGTQLATYTARCIENEILMLLRSDKKHRQDLSLTDIVGLDKEGNELSIIDIIAERGESTTDKVERSMENQKLLEVIEKTLSKREYTVICMRYGLKGGRCYAQREVAGFLKISRSYISRIEKKALEKLKKKISKQDFYQ